MFFAKQMGTWGSLHYRVNVNEAAVRGMTTTRMTRDQPVPGLGTPTSGPHRSEKFDHGYELCEEAVFGGED